MKNLIPWFTLDLMDLAFRVLFHRFQIIFDHITTELSVTTGTNQQMQSNTAVSTVNIPKPRQFKSVFVNNEVKYTYLT